ncbi:sugar kinase [Anaerocolumna sp. MB42-C2]|uniref:sugar kinase n=1 Tax=Anaerocolumna sp. MB42-C2 TaxID=3070997 RepID=UPI0027E0E42A|nr:sugar kinase [Anaerocolumna sp. MB42-C2]WMJ88570.1 sugar kinase [Anaerocolumna sp. MB42-C2]
MDLVTIGETMVSFVPKGFNSIQYGADFSMRIAGAESNTAIGIRKLGHSAGWISRVGKDEFGQFVLRMIRAEDIDTTQVTTDNDHKTGIMFKSTSPSNETRVSYYRDLSAATYLEPSLINKSYIANAKILHITGITPILSKSCYETLRYAITTARANHTLVSFDPNIRFKLWKNQDHSDMMKELISLSDILLIGREEADFLFYSNQIDTIFEMIFSSYNLQYVAIKDGSRGAWAADKTHTHFIPAVKCKSIDPIGAGDAFNAGFLSGLLDNLDLNTCGRLGGIAGAYATTTFGDIEGLLSKEEMLDILNNKTVVTR